jgi:hypothetical protein
MLHRQKDGTANVGMAGALTREQGEERYRSLRRSLVMAVPMAWLVVGLAIARHPAAIWVGLLLTVAALYPFACLVMLRSVRRDIARRVAPRADRSGLELVGQPDSDGQGRQTVADPRRRPSMET